MGIIGSHVDLTSSSKANQQHSTRRDLCHHGSRMKPRLFIGSSTENLEVARAIEDQLRNDADCNVWDQDIFNLSAAALTDLLTALDNADFGVFVLAGDDKVVSPWTGARITAR